MSRSTTLQSQGQYSSCGERLRGVRLGEGWSQGALAQDWASSSFPFLRSCIGGHPRVTAAAWMMDDETAVVSHHTGGLVHQTLLIVGQQTR